MEAVKMVGLKRLIRQRFTAVVGSVHCSVPSQSQHLARLTPKRFLDLHQFGNKEAIEKERARLGDEMNRGYFADMAEFKQHGGKIAVANKVIIPATKAVKFPDFEVSFSDGKSMKLPIRVWDRAVDSDRSSVPKATLVCLTFRASSQGMINSWSVPFGEAFKKSKDVHLYQVSFIDSWLLCRSPIKRFLLWTMKKPNHPESEDTLRTRWYIFLLDNFGRVRWQGFGSATEDELSSLLSCTSLLLDEK